ncbi:MAG: cation diffusion facilitator family transporter [Sulfolobales archaeon]|nr:cation diffusion facilitator family transporter [Sulfolobales archaeon]MDW8082772.1 cation diffusion facilitator family transporter [Sulfolobales archaeon]
MYSGWISKKRAAYLEGFISIAINSILFLVKYSIGTLFSSVAVVADAFHTLSDTLTSIVLVVGYRIADRPADREHPFGHGRAETIGGLVIGVLLGVAAYTFAVSSYEKLLSGISLIYSDLLIVILVISAIVKAALSLWAYNLGRKHLSQPIAADAWHHLSDSAAAWLLAIAIYAGRDYWWLDGVLGLAVSILIFLTAVKIVYESSTEILGKSPSKIELDKLIEIVREAHPTVKRVHHIHFHKYGTHTEVTLHIELPGDTALREAHEIATAIENAIRSKLGYETTIHVEPAEPARDHVD